MTGPTQLTGETGSKVSVYLSILQAAGSLLSNPALGIKGAGQIVSLIGFAGTVVRDIAAGADKLRVVNQELQALVAAGRAPTDTEWAVLQDKLNQGEALWDPARARI